MKHCKLCKKESLDAIYCSKKCYDLAKSNPKVQKVIEKWSEAIE